MRLFLFSLFSLAAITLVCCRGVDADNHTRFESHPTVRGPGSWRVRLKLTGNDEEALIFNTKPSGIATAMFEKESRTKLGLPATWFAAENRISFSTEIELPIGTCCRDNGTLVLKGKIDARGVATGKAVFITATDDSENFNGLRTLTGTFTAVRVVEKTSQ